jgi:hypothetical protein
MQLKRDNKRRDLIASLAPVFKQDEQIARGKYKSIAPLKPVKDCAPHNYRPKQDSKGEFWQCDCGKILTNDF